MRRLKSASMVLIAMGLASTQARVALAESAPVCHDMPMRQQVLDEGQKARLGRAGSHVMGSVYAGNPERLLETDDERYSRLERFQHLSNRIPENKTYHFASQAGCEYALRDAALFENSYHFIQAKKIYEGVLENSARIHLSKLARASALSGVTRSEIALNLPDVHSCFNDETGFKTIGYMDFGGSFLPRRLGPYLQAIEKCKAADEDLDQYAHNFLQAYHMSDRSEYLLLKAAIDTRRARTKEAAICLIAAMSATDLASTELAKLLNSHPQEIAEIEPLLLSSLKPRNAELILTIAKVDRDQKRPLPDCPAISTFFKTLPLKSQKLTTGSIEELVKKAEPSQRSLVLQSIAEMWLDNEAFMQQHKTVLDAVNECKWSGEITEFLRIFPEPADSNNFSKRLMLASYFADRQNNHLALEELRRSVTTLRKNYENHSKTLTEVEKLNEFMVIHPDFKAQLPTILEQCKNVEAFSKEQLRRRECLDMAAKLNETAFGLQRDGKDELATKLYKNALEIKTVNLEENDPEIANQLVDLARAQAGQKDFTEASKNLDKAISILRKNPDADPRDRINALTTYGELLNSSGKTEEGAAAYDEARQLSMKLQETGS